MATVPQWYFSKEQLTNSPSRKCGIDSDKELSYRQQAANFIQDMGQRLQVTQLCINTAIVYMHRFYVFHSFSKFHRNAIATCALFLAAKVEEQPRKLEHVIRIAHICLHRDTPPLDTKSEAYMDQAHELVGNENIMLQTLGFDIAIEHPHTYVVKCCQLVRASKDLAQTSYIMATNSLHLTTMSLQYKPTVVACVCIHLACKWSSWELPCSSEGKDWFWYVDRSVTLELLEELTSEFLVILDKCPSRLKRKITSGSVKELAPPVEKRSNKDNAGTTASTSASAGFAQEKGQNRQEEKSKVSDRQNVRLHKTLTSPVSSKENQQQQYLKPSIAAGNQLVPIVQEQLSPSKHSKNENHNSLTLTAYKEMKEKEKEQTLLEEKVKAQQQSRIEMNHSNPTQSHSVSVNNKRSNKDERKSHYHHQNTSEKEKLKYQKMMYAKHEENSDLVNEKSSAEFGSLNLKTEETPVLQQKASDEVKQIRITNNRLETVLPEIHTEIKKSESMSVNQEASTISANSHNHQEKNSVRSSGSSHQGNHHFHHSEQDDRLRHDIRHASETVTNFKNIPQSNANQEHIPVTKINKLRHQKHRTLPSAKPQISQNDMLVCEKEKIKAVMEDLERNSSKMNEIVSVVHKSESDLSKRVDPVAVDKTNEPPQNKADRREKHKHKHSSHNFEKERLSGNPDQVSPGSLKITIPRDKIKISGTSSQQSSSGSPQRGGIKLKIQRKNSQTSEASTVVSNANATPNSIPKLVITKDKQKKYISYSASGTQKSDRETRKRERSPSELSSRERTTEVSSIPQKIAKYDQASVSRKSNNATHFSNDGSDIPLPPEIIKVNLHSHNLNDNQQLDSGGKQMITSAPIPYLGPKPTPQNFVAYGRVPQYYPQYFNAYHPAVHLAPRIPQIYNQPPMPPPLPGDPPLPREPPPIPPPLPPE